MQLKKRQKGIVQIEDFPKFTCPDFAAELVFPSDITALDSVNVSRLMGRFTQMLAWASQSRTDADIEVLRAKSMLESAKTRFLASNSTVRNSSHRWRIDFVLDTEPEVVAAKQKLLKAEARRLTANNLCDVFERNIWVLSRELSRKAASRDGLAFEAAAPGKFRSRL